MKAEDKRDGHGWIVTEGMDRYNETEQPEPTSRVLDGSSDHGYSQEWVGYGTVDGIPVKAVYLFDEDDICDEDGEEYEEADMYPWELALEQGRIVVEIDKLTDEQYGQLADTGELTA